MTDDPGDEERAGDESTGTDLSEDAVEHAREAEKWKRAGSEAIETLLETQMQALRTEVDDTLASVEHGSGVSSLHVSRLRRSIADLERTVEDALAELADDAEDARLDDAAEESPTADGADAAEAGPA